MLEREYTVYTPKIMLNLIVLSSLYTIINLGLDVKNYSQYGYPDMVDKFNEVKECMQS